MYYDLLRIQLNLILYFYQRLHIDDRFYILTTDSSHLEKFHF